ncbi:hypothetical protein [Nostoc sp.]|uniref:hypothetical protein n=1 Tax=Nostoc sp. TaxID=1180 RepID=UPI002FF52054
MHKNSRHWLMEERCRTTSLRDAPRTWKQAGAERLFELAVNYALLLFPLRIFQGRSACSRASPQASACGGRVRHRSSSV